MASSADQEKVAEEVDGNNRVVPAGAEKPKKKGLFGKSSKHEKKAKTKSEGKEDIPQEDEAKDKKSEKDKKEGKKERKKDKNGKSETKKPDESKKDKKEHKAKKEDKKDKTSKSKHDNDHKKEDKKESKSKSKSDKKEEVSAESPERSSVASSVASVSSEPDEHQKIQKKPFRLSFGKGKKKAKRDDDSTTDEIPVSKTKKDRSHKDKSSKTQSEERNKSKASSKSLANAPLPGKRLSEIVKDSQTTGEKLEENSEGQSGLVQSSEVHIVENGRHAEEKRPEVQIHGDEAHEVPKPSDEGDVIEDVIASQDEIAGPISPDVEAQNDKDDDNTTEETTGIALDDKVSPALNEDTVHLLIGDEMKTNLPHDVEIRSEEIVVSNVNETERMPEELEGREQILDDKKVEEVENQESEVGDIDAQVNVPETEDKTEKLEIKTLEPEMQENLAKNKLDLQDKTELDTDEPESKETEQEEDKPEPEEDKLEAEEDKVKLDEDKQEPEQYKPLEEKDKPVKEEDKPGEEKDKPVEEEDKPEKKEEKNELDERKVELEGGRLKDEEKREEDQPEANAVPGLQEKQESAYLNLTNANEETADTKVRSRKGRESSGRKSREQSAERSIEESVHHTKRRALFGMSYCCNCVIV